MSLEKFNHAVKLAKSGNKREALPIFKEIVQADKDNEKAWLGLYFCVEKKEQKKYCLKQIIRINPDNLDARKKLLKMEEQGNSVHKNPQEKKKSSTPTRSKQTLWLWILGVGAFLCIGMLFGGGLLIKQGGFTQILSVETVTSTPTLEPTATQTFTFTPSPTLTNTPTITPTFTLTNTPTATFTATSTMTPEPMTSLAKRAEQVVLNQGFTPDDKACRNKPSCQAYRSEEPYMLMIIHNDGFISITSMDEYHLLLDYVKTPGTSPPYDHVMVWYTDIIKKIYSPVSPNLDFTIVGVMDIVTNLRDKVDFEDSYGYVIEGQLLSGEQMKMTITPP